MFITISKTASNRLKEEKVVVATQGEERNVIALTPPLCFTLDNARRVIEAFDKALTKVDQIEEVPQDASSTSVLGYKIVLNLGSSTRYVHFYFYLLL